MPGGTDSNFRSWGDDTVYVDRGQRGAVPGREVTPRAAAWARVLREAAPKAVAPPAFDRLHSLCRFLARDGDDIAAVLAQPIPGNAQSILPREGSEQAIPQLPSV